MVTQLVLLLPIMIAMLALVVDCANLSRCKALASAAASEGARYAVARGRACARLAGTEMASLKKVYEVYETTQVYVL